MKCSKHVDKDAVAMCERCNLFYCGDCVLSSNGKCPACGNILSSPRSMLSFEIDRNELYKGRGSPHLLEAVSSLYLEPVRTIRRLEQYVSLTNGVINVSLIYLIATVVRVAAFVILSPFIPGGQGVQTISSPQFLFALLINIIIGFGVSILSWLFSSAILHFPAKLLGGKGTFVQQSSLLSYVMLAVLPLSIFVIVVVLVPLLGVLLTLLGSLAVLIYTSFLTVLVIREINGFNTLRAVISLIISILASFILSVLLAILIFLPTIMQMLGKSPLL